ncbi:hypothetical protein ACH5RR_023856 [Cinchona calisaya]|uniref:phosphatidate cytidylyltransferase n=1 Tax=Cinchona calisaya TaxID=153742 RepID=A0ABD2ZD96_9GENT
MDSQVVFAGFMGNSGKDFRRIITAVARADPDLIGDAPQIKYEANKGNDLPVDEESVSESQRKATQLKKRILFGLGIGLSAGAIVLAGGWVFTGALAAAVFIASREYFELV